jgi:hypothetical protein
MHDKTAAYTANSGKQAFVKREWSKRESGFVAILFISSILVFSSASPDPSRVPSRRLLEC